MYHAQDFCQRKVFFCVTGCSLGFTKQLMGFGGASKFIYGIYCPYSTILLNKLNIDENYVSEQACKLLIQSSKSNFDIPDDIVIVSLTAALYYDGQRNDRVNHFLIDVFINNNHNFLHYIFNTNELNRVYQDDFCNKSIIDFTQLTIANYY